MNVRVRAAGRMYGHMLANTVAGLMVLALVRAVLTVVMFKRSQPNLSGGRDSRISRLGGGDPLAQVFDLVSRMTGWSPQTAMEECAIAA